MGIGRDIIEINTDMIIYKHIHRYFGVLIRFKLKVWYSTELLNVNLCVVFPQKLYFSGLKIANLVCDLICKKLLSFFWVSFDFFVFNNVGLSIIQNYYTSVGFLCKTIVGESEKR